MRYPVAIHKDVDSDYGVIVPDLPGCFSAGETLNEALTNAAEAISDHIAILMENGDPVPKGKLIDDHKNNNDYAGANWAFVDSI